MILHRHVCIVFFPNPPIGILELPCCSSRRWPTFLKCCYWLVRSKIQYARDDEGNYFCINQNKNIDNDLYCSSNAFPNLTALLTMVHRSLQLVAQLRSRLRSIFKSQVFIGCSTEILRDKLHEGCYNVQWLKMRCGNHYEKLNLILLRAMLLATKMFCDFMIVRHVTPCRLQLVSQQNCETSCIV